jgi:hypothetical protein
MLIRAGATAERRASALDDVRGRLPLGWAADIYESSGVDIVVTHVGE